MARSMRAPRRSDNQRQNRWLDRNPEDCNPEQQRPAAERVAGSGLKGQEGVFLWVPLVVVLCPCPLVVAASWGVWLCGPFTGCNGAKLFHQVSKAIQSASLFSSQAAPALHTSRA